MQSISPKDILTTLHLIRAGLASGLLTKEEVIDWADNIITEDEQPDIFFIDLALASSKSKKDIIYYFSDYLNFESPAVPGRPLLGLLYKLYKSGQLTLEQTIKSLFRLKFEATFNDTEEGFIYSLDNELDLAQDNIYSSMEDVRKETERFLELYKHYSINNFKQWQDLDTTVDDILKKEQKQQQEQYEKHAAETENKSKKWWQFW